MLILPQKTTYITNFSFLSFKTGLISTTVPREDLIQPIGKKNSFYTLTSHATSNLQVPCAVGITCASI
jgi:hypothetical protein